MNRWNRGLAIWMVGVSGAVCLLFSGCSWSSSADAEGGLVEQRIEIETVLAQQTRIATTFETVGTLLPIRATTIVSEVDEAQAHWDLATVELERIRRLAATNSASQGQLDAAQATEAQSRAALAQARAAFELATEGPTVEQLAVAQAEVAQAEVSVRQHQRDLEKTVIRSPYPAVITDRYVDVGDRLTAMPRVEIMQVVDPRVLFAEIDVPERLLGLVREQAAARVYGPTCAEPILGRVQLINERVDPETRTFRARVGIDNRAGHLKAGGLARVELELSTEPRATVVPRHAVSFSNGQPSVFVYRADGHVDRRLVTLGIINSEACQILGGLAPGEPVAVTNLALLTDRASVRLAGDPSAQRPSRIATREVHP